jgi:hypothetical protein
LPGGEVGDIVHRANLEFKYASRPSHSSLTKTAACLGRNLTTDWRRVRERRRIQQFVSYPRLLNSPVRLALVDGDVLEALGAGVLGERADETVIGVLFEHMSGPAGDAADHEDERVKINGNPQDVIRGR